MAEDVASSTTKLLAPILQAWLQRDERKAATAAGRLTFWRDGMLGQLDLIANGKSNEAIFSELEDNFKRTADRVTHAIQELARVRDILSPGPIAEQIDAVLHSDQFGKTSIRREIENLLRNRAQPDAAHMASNICRAIQTLNAELRRLHRMVYSD